MDAFTTSPGQATGPGDSSNEISAVGPGGNATVVIADVDAAGDLIGTVTDADGAHLFIDRGGKFNTYDPPSTGITTSLNVVGTDAAGNVYGSYSDSTGQHGFVEKNGVITTISVDPNETEIDAVNASGDVVGLDGVSVSENGFVQRAATGVTTQIVGFMFNESEGERGYTLTYPVGAEINDAGTVLVNVGGSSVFAGDTKAVHYVVRYEDVNRYSYVTIDGADGVYAEGINDAGSIYGYYVDDNENQIGFVQTSTGATTSYAGPDASGDTKVSIVAIDPAGDVFGTYQSGGGTHVFVQKAGSQTETQIDTALNDQSITVAGTDQAGDLAGTYVDASGKQHGFFYDSATGQTATVDGSPTAVATEIDGIDAVGDVFGSYSDGAGAQHSFISTAASVPAITGTHASSVTAEAPVAPFTGVTITDIDRTETLTIALSGGGGTLQDGSGFSGTSTLQQIATGHYQLTGTAAAVTAELDALSFTPMAPAPGTSATTTFSLTDTSSAAGSPTGTASDAATLVTDTASAIPPTSPASPGAPAPDAVSISQQVSYNRGVFTLTGTASSAAGVRSVEISADVDGVAADLGAATVNADGTYSFSDRVGPHTQGFITATVTDGAGVEATSADPGFSLTGGLRGPGGTTACQTLYTADGTAETAVDLFTPGGSQRDTIKAPGLTVTSAYADRFNDGGQPETTFVFDPGHGTDVVNLFRVDGSDHDSLSFSGSDYGNSVADVLRHTFQTKAGDAVIYDPAAGDAVRLTGITKAQLAANQGDITFHG